jgi:hypothetical protein
VVNGAVATIINVATIRHPVTTASVTRLRIWLWVTTRCAGCELT